MYKSISNCPSEDKIIVESNGRSPICNQVQAGKIQSGQLYCCNQIDGICTHITDNTPLTPENCSQNKKLSQCHNLTTFDACNRANNSTDFLARRCPIAGPAHWLAKRPSF